MAKEQDVPQYVQEFLDAVYDDHGALALASFNEEAALRDATERIAALKAIVDRLPKTADGVPATPGMKMYRGDQEFKAEVLPLQHTNASFDGFGGWHSTRQAALAQKGVADA